MTVAISVAKLEFGPTILVGQGEANNVSKERRQTTLRSGSSLCTGLHNHSKHIPEELKYQLVIMTDAQIRYECAYGE